ncbi:hypothetical protein BCR44DRAFT_1257515 [Catenaria anguillulae PL171]|uniref:Uncharacterized protein n=1 Tax=Catenaria anguillulae PL171 TaxID=765915 RepID=A0A1Y2HBN8_9FUNG|nr:hypothetical protein BCR44DRAFT_1257515 [Catenaria anguillulae PL171]
MSSASLLPSGLSVLNSTPPQQATQPRQRPKSQPTDSRPLHPRPRPLAAALCTGPCRPHRAPNRANPRPRPRPRPAARSARFQRPASQKARPRFSSASLTHSRNPSCLLWALPFSQPSLRMLNSVPCLRRHPTSNSIPQFTVGTDDKPAPQVADKARWPCAVAAHWSRVVCDGFARIGILMWTADWTRHVCGPCSGGWPVYLGAVIGLSIPLAMVKALSLRGTTVARRQGGAGQAGGDTGRGRKVSRT